MKASFFYDLGSPYAYLAAERIDMLLSIDVEWRPVLAGGIFKAIGKTPWPATPERGTRMAEIERRAAARGVKLQWPKPWPNDWLPAMRAATYAHQHGQGKQFALEAFRVHFAEGRPLEESDNIFLAAERAGLVGADVLAAIDDAEVKALLRAHTDGALALGVHGVPSVTVGGCVFWGDDRLDEVAAALQRLEGRPNQGAQRTAGQATERPGTGSR